MVQGSGATNFAGTTIRTSKLRLGLLPMLIHNNGNLCPRWQILPAGDLITLTLTATGNAGCIDAVDTKTFYYSLTPPTTVGRCHCSAFPVQEP
jgi:hypothetical protein